MGFQRIIISIYLKNQKCIRFDLGKGLFYSALFVVLSVPLGFYVVKNELHNSINLSKILNYKFQTLIPLNISKTVTTDNKTQNNQNENWLNSGYLIEKFNIKNLQSKLKMSFFLTKKIITKKINKGELFAQFYNKKGEIIYKSKSEEFKFKNGRNSIFTLDNKMIDSLSHIKLFLKDSSGKVYNKIIQY